MGQNKLSAVSFTATVCVNIFTVPVHHIQINALSADNSEQSSIWSNQIEYNTILIQMHVCHNMKNRNNARSTAACGPNALLFITHETGKIRRMWGKHLEDPLKEIQAMQLLEGSNFGDHHPHIMHSQVALQDQKYLYNITPYCKGGDLGGVVMDQINRKSRMDEKDATHWFRQILLALHHLQLKGVCHRNISLENIVVHGDSCKLVDFALALRVPYHQSDTIGGVTDVSDGTNRLLIIPQGQSDNFTFMSPEILNDEVFDGSGIDLWSVGVILYIMLFGCKPFKCPHPTDEQFRRLTLLHVAGEFKLLGNQIVGWCHRSSSNDASIWKGQKAYARRGNETPLGGFVCAGRNGQE